MDKNAVASALHEISVLLELSGANPFKIRAFAASAQMIDGLTDDMALLAREGRLTSVKGIGPGIAKVITELLDKGRSTELDELRSSVPPGLVEMLSVPGLGPKKVVFLYRELGIKTISALSAAAESGKLERLAGFGKKTQENIVKGIRLRLAYEGRSLFPNAEHIAIQMIEHLRQLAGLGELQEAGSLRRRKEIVGDIDILASLDGAKRNVVMEHFCAFSGVVEVRAKGETKSTVLLEGGILCDLRIVEKGEFPFALQYFTGSKDHNVTLRKLAQAKGWSLNEYGFSMEAGSRVKARATRPPRCSSEEEIYVAVGCSFVPPEMREGQGELERASEGTLPRLIELSDLKGAFHCHTTYSDGLHSLEEMARGAIALGWEYLGIADHSPSAAYAGGLDRKKLKAQAKEIEGLNRALPIRLLHGTESDILSDGSLDWPDPVLAGLDYVVASVHSGFKMTEASMTHRIISAMKNKHVKMLGHPTGRLLLSREPYPVNVSDIIQAASDYGTMIEINAQPSRLDLDWRWCRMARDKGVTLVINPDAHRVDELAYVRYGINVARKGWVTHEGVFNTLHRKEVEQVLSR